MLFRSNQRETPGEEHAARVEKYTIKEAKKRGRVKEMKRRTAPEHLEPVKEHLKLILISRGGHRERRIGEKYAIGKQDICRSITKPLLRKRVLHRETAERTESVSE